MNRVFTKTIEYQMTATKRHPSGFDYLRLILSVSIIAWHTIVVCYGKSVETLFWISPSRPLYYFIIPSFFALSGFLVAGSLARVNSIPEFLTLRILRIVPALCCEVLISAFLIGTALTELPLKDYFSDGRFYEYFLNIIGDIHYFLPGVFTHNATDWVNIQLWTIPYELECYALITALACMRIVRYPAFLGMVTFLFTLFVFFGDLYSGRLVLNDRPPEHLTVVCFLWGVLLYLYRQKIPYSFPLFWCALIVAWLALTYAETSYLASLPVAYITMYIGLMNPRKIFLVSSGDYSYGLYLYGFPIQQAVYCIFPAYRVWYIHLPISLFLTSICACLSWTFLESRILGRKKQVLALVNALCMQMSRTLAAEQPEKNARGY